MSLETWLTWMYDACAHACMTRAHGCMIHEPYMHAHVQHICVLCEYFHQIRQFGTMMTTKSYFVRVASQRASPLTYDTSSLCQDNVGRPCRSPVGTMEKEGKGRVREG